ncbi:MAG: hypothetical protein IJP17_06555 [Clostridia bacterium]|nr:hypothetical protein [Clostridia bacterium]
MKKFSIICLFALVILTLCGCSASGGDALPAVSGADTVSGADAVSASDAEVIDWREEIDAADMELANVIVSSTDAFNAEDVAAYMAVIDPESEIYASTEQSAKDVFAKYQLKAHIDNIVVLSREENTALLEVTQTTLRQEEGKTFYPTQAVLEHTLVRRGGVWYISHTVVKSSVELLEDRWDLFEVFAGTVAG